MARAGYCSECGQSVWLEDDGGCINGHPPSQISNVYEAKKKRLAGYCGKCKQNVWLKEDGSCESGHPTNQITNVYEAAEQSSEGLSKRASSENVPKKTMLIRKGKNGAGGGINVTAGEFSASKKAEIEHLQKVISSSENVSKKTVLIQIGKWSGGIKATAGELSAEWMCSTIVKKNSTDERLTIPIAMAVVKTAGWNVGRSHAYSAVGRSLTHQDIMTALADASDVKAEIIRQLESNMSRVIRSIFHFGEERHIIHEIDQITFNIQMGIPLFWLEGASLLPAAKVKKRSAIVPYNSTVDFAEVSKLTDLSDKTLASFWNISEDRIKFLL